MKQYIIKHPFSSMLCSIALMIFKLPLCFKNIATTTTIIIMMIMIIIMIMIVIMIMIMIW